MSKTNLIFEFKDLETKQKQVQKKIENIFNAAGKIKPVEIEIDGKTKRNNGISYKQIFCEFADSQTVIFKVKQTGDIFEVLLNKKILPIANQDNHRKAVGEVINAMEKGRSAFQKKLAKAKATLPPSVKSTIVSKQQAMDEKKAALLEAIQAVQSELDAVNAEIDTYQKQLDAGKNLANHIQNIMPDTQEETNTEAQLAREENNELERHREQPSGEISVNSKIENEAISIGQEKLNKKLSEYSSLNESSLKFWVRQGMGHTNRDTSNKDTKAFLKTFNDVPSLLNSILQKIKESDKITFSTFPYYDDKQYFVVYFYNKDKEILKMSGASNHSGLGYELYSIFEPYFKENGGKDFSSEKAYAIVEKYFQNYLSATENNTENNSQKLVENNTNNSRRDKDIAELQKIISGEDTRTNKELRPFIAELTDLYKNDEEIKNLMNQALNTLINKAKQKRDELAKNI